MQQGFGLNLTPTVVSFLISLIAIYLFFALFGHSDIGQLLYAGMILDPSRVIDHFELWRLFSYAFLHDLSSPFHLIFNALLFVMIGPTLEEHWGERRFVTFIVLAILLGGLSVLLAYALNLSHAYVIGFSAVSVGLIVAWGLTFPQSTMYFFMLVPISGKQLVIFTVALEVIYAVSSSSVSSAAHFGGMAAGCIMALDLYNYKKIMTKWRQAKMRRNLRR